MNPSRRTFLITSLGVASTLALSREALAAPTPVSESDPTAVALGYKANATQVDKSKFANYAAGQMCGNCQYFQGKPTDASAPCPMFGGNLVSNKGWCSAYTKKA